MGEQGGLGTSWGCGLGGVEAMLLFLFSFLTQGLVEIGRKEAGRGFDVFRDVEGLNGFTEREGFGGCDCWLRERLLFIYRGVIMVWTHRVFLL